MPMVPETFAPSVSQGEMPMTPATGPWVSPMKNSAPSLLEQTGSTLMQAGDTEARLGNAIGDAVRQTVDDGMVKNALVQFQQSSQNILYNPQSGYLNTRGMDAQNQSDATSKALDKTLSSARGMLTNPMQQRAFDLAANDQVQAINRQMWDHRHQQVTQYGIQQNSDYADSQMISARDAYLKGDQAGYQKYVGQAQAAVLKVAELNGAAPESDVAHGMLRAKNSDLVRGVIIGLLDNHQSPEAKQYLAAQQDKIDARTFDILSNAVKSEYDRNLIETKRDAGIAGAQNGGSVPYTYGQLATGSAINPMKITDVPGTPRPNGRVHDGYDIAMPQGTAVNAPLDGKVVKVWNDDKFGGGLSMRVQLADGNTLGIAHLSATNVNEGDAVSKGQPIALSGKTGNATGAVLHVALQNSDGQYIDYFGASKAQPNPAGIADPDVLQKAIDITNSDDSLDPFQKRQVVRAIQVEHSQQRAIQEQQYQEVKGKIVDQLAQNGDRFDLIPAAQKAQLRPSDVQAFQEMQDEDKLAKSDLDTRIAYQNLPPEQRTPKWVKDNYQNLKPDTYVSLLTKANELQQNADNLPEAKVQDTMFRSALLENNFTNLLDPKTDGDKQQILKLRASVDDVATSMQTALRRKLRPDEWQNLLNSELKNSVFVERARVAPWAAVGKMALGALPGGGVQLPVTQDDLHYGQPAQLSSVSSADLGKTYVMSGGKKVYTADIPPGQRLQYELNRFKRGLPITEQGIADDWVHFGMPK